MRNVDPLLKTRFKLSFNKAGNCTVFRKDQAEELEGQWVWLIDATDGQNDKLVHSDALREAYLAGWKDCYEEPRPFSAARDSLCNRYLESSSPITTTTGKAQTP